MPPKNPNLVTEVIPESIPESKLKNLISSEATSESKKDKSGEKLGHEFHERRRDSSTEEKSSGRERLKRHRVEVAGRVWIPEQWGQEDFLKDWIDCSVFDAAVRNKGIMSARASLMEQGRRPNSTGFGIQNPC
ncbi:hypothetical protein ACS0TY_016569 [Phlomoides rotata]